MIYKTIYFELVWVRKTMTHMRAGADEKHRTLFFLARCPPCGASRALGSKQFTDNRLDNFVDLNLLIYHVNCRERTILFDK